MKSILTAETAIERDAVFCCVLLCIVMRICSERWSYGQLTEINCISVNSHVESAEEGYRMSELDIVITLTSIV